MAPAVAVQSPAAGKSDLFFLPPGRVLAQPADPPEPSEAARKHDARRERCQGEEGGREPFPDGDARKSVRNAALREAEALSW